MAKALAASDLKVLQDAGKTHTVEIAPGVIFGSGRPVVIAGPCAVESWEQIHGTARAVHAAGAQALRGGVYKPRTSPYSFQGLGDEGLRLLAEAGAATGLPVVTEVLDVRDVEKAARCSRLLQVGARSMQNFALLRELGRSDHPVLLKRGMSATLEEWLLAAEYLLAEGNWRVILCERGSRSFETHTRNTLDLGVAVAARQLSHLPVIADPSHAAGRRELVAPLSRAALAAGLDGLLIEVHVEPEHALSDGPQSLAPAEFSQLMASVHCLSRALTGAPPAGALA